MRTGLGQTRLLEITVPLALAAAVRLAPVAGSGFPLNDGGMFWTMAGDLRANGFVPPMFTTYNGGSIPFAYPPLGIYLAAIFHGADGIAGLTYGAWVPAILSILAVGVVFVLALEFTGSRMAAFIAACAFALLPAAFVQMIHGGGVTRALGALLALLSALAAVRGRTRGGRRWDAVAAVFGGLALLSHPSAGLAAAVATAVLRPDPRHRSSLAATVAVMGGIVVVASPWWLMVFVRHGLETLVSAASLGGPIDAATQLLVRLLTWTVSGELYFPFVGALGIFGMLLALSRSQWRLPAWFAVQLLVDSRLGFVFACVPLAVMAGQGGVALLRLMVPPAGFALDGPGVGDAFRSSRRIRWSVPLALTTVAVTVGLSLQQPSFPVWPVAPEDRAAMAWARENLPTDATLAVVTGDVFGLQGTDEWLPSLAGRVSVATPQGTEWLGRGRWKQMFRAHGALQACAGRDASCLDEWAATTGIQFQYVYVPKGRLYGPQSAEDCCGILRTSLSGSPRARLVFDGPGSSIWEFAPAPEVTTDVVADRIAMTAPGPA